MTAGINEEPQMPTTRSTRGGSARPRETRETGTSAVNASDVGGSRGHGSAGELDAVNAILRHADGYDRERLVSTPSQRASPRRKP